MNKKKEKHNIYQIEYDAMIIRRLDFIERSNFIFVIKIETGLIKSLKN